MPRAAKASLPSSKELRRALRKKVLKHPLHRPLVYFGAVALVVFAHALYRGLRREAIDRPNYDPIVRIQGDFEANQRLAEILKGNRLSGELSREITAALRKVLNPRRIRAGDRYVIDIATTGAFMHLTLERDRERYVVHYGHGTGLTATMRAAPLRTVVRQKAGDIKSSVWESMTNAKIPPGVIDEFERIFRFTIDFLTEPRNGDRFAVSWEERRTARGTLMETRVLAAMYDGEVSRSNTAILHRGHFWSGTGESLNRIFLAAPLKRYRITSRFSRRRFHPIWRVYRPHLGIDYGAPIGTPIISVGAGRISFHGWKRGFGRTVMVKHRGDYETLYAHMSRYESGLRVGSQVRQGQVIGYVGQTGHATGPHLDFRIRHKKKWKNFLRMKIPADRRVPLDQIGEFESLKAQRLRALRKIIPRT